MIYRDYVDADTAIKRYVLKRCENKKIREHHESCDSSRARIDLEASTASGCPTCGPLIDREISYYLQCDHKSFYWYHSVDVGYDFDITGIIREVCELGQQ